MFTCNEMKCVMLCMLTMTTTTQDAWQGGFSTYSLREQQTTHARANAASQPTSSRCDKAHAHVTIFICMQIAIANVCYMYKYM